MGSGFRLLLPALLCLVTACDVPDGSGGAGTAEVQGEIMYPPKAGQVVLQAETGDGDPRAVVIFPVSENGQYVVNLPPPSRLSEAGKTSMFPVLPDLWLLGITSSNCAAGALAGKPPLVLNDTAAKMAVVGGGQFLVGGVQVGQIMSATQAVGGAGTQELQSSKRLYAYSDRAVKITGTLDCVLTRQDGSHLSGQVNVNYDLTRGWNVLVLQTSRQDQQSPLMISASAEAPRTPVQWHYVMVQ